MSKDRFNKFKPINYSSNWKATGSKLSGSISSVPQKPKRYNDAHLLLQEIYTKVLPFLNEWEANFMNSIVNNKNLLSLKQKNTLEKIYNNYHRQAKLKKVDNFYQF